MTNRIVWSSCAAAVMAFTVGVAAQSNVQTPTQSPVNTNQQGTRTQAPSLTGSAAAQQVTLVGCVQREADARTGAVSAANPSSEFVLANAMPANASAGISGSATGATSSAGATGTSGTGRPGAVDTPGASASARSSISSNGTTYSLTGDKEKDLAQFVGQRVEIVAKMESGHAGSTGATGTSGLGSSTRTPGAASDRQGEPSAPDAAAAAAARPAPAAGEPVGDPAGAAVARSSAGGSASASASASSPTMQRVEIVSFRAVGGSCQ